jgi:hypothetical protein
MLHGGNAAGVLIALGVILVISTLVGAIILRAAVSLCNTMTGGARSRSAVPEPSLGQAMAITFFTSLVNAVVGFVVGLARAEANPKGGGVDLTAQLATIPVSMFVMTCMVAALLPTTFGRAILVTVCHFLIAAIIVGAIVAVTVLSLQ